MSISFPSYESSMHMSWGFNYAGPYHYSPWYYNLWLSSPLGYFIKITLHKRSQQLMSHHQQMMVVLIIKSVCVEKETQGD